MEFTSKNQLLYFFLQGKISLSQYDYKFLANLQTMISTYNRVTSNQDSLFDRLVIKYNRQLNKHGIDSGASLEWNVPTVTSTEEFTGAMIKLENNSLILRTPFNKQFIREFNTISDNPFTWDKETRTYRSGVISSYDIAFASKICSKYFSSVKFDGELSPVVDRINEVSAKFWNPTLTVIGGRPIVVATSEQLAKIVNTMVIDKTPRTVYELSKLGVKTDEMLMESDPKLKFAASRTIMVDSTELDELIDSLVTCGIDSVLISSGVRYIYNTDAIVELCGSRGIKTELLNGGLSGFKMISEKYPVLITNSSSFDYANLTKIIKLVKSMPINIS